MVFARDLESTLGVPLPRTLVRWELTLLKFLYCAETITSAFGVWGSGLQSSGRRIRDYRVEGLGFEV